MTPYAQRRLPRDPLPGTLGYALLERHLWQERDRMEKLTRLEDAIPAAKADARLAIRDLELRLGLEPSYPPPAPRGRVR